MNERELDEGEIVMEVTKIIGLGESQRKIYEDLISKNCVSEELQNAYFFHQRELESLIKYQRTLGDSA